jgi:FMN phosphatase YigB (HAD superfamily)
MHALLILDVDDVILDMDRLAEAAFVASEAPLASALGDPELARAVSRDFAGAYAALRSQLRAPSGAVEPEAAAVQASMRRWQRGVEEAGHAPLAWSRQAMLAVALERHGLAVTRALIDGVVGRYWESIAAGTRLFEDAAALIRAAERAGTLVHLATNSDGHLALDEAAGTFRYDPEASRAAKWSRLALVGSVGLGPEAVTIGDPVGKPHRAYYRAVLADVARRLGRAPPLEQTLVVGDSLTHDVLPFLELGARHGAWLLRGEQPEAQHPGVRVVRSLDALSSDWGRA